MTSADDATVAGDVYALELVEAPPTLWRRVRHLGGGLLAAATGDFSDDPVGGPPIGDYVVRRRDDGAEVLRVPSGAGEEAAATRAWILEQLETLSPAEFEQAWAISGPLD